MPKGCHQQGRYPEAFETSDLHDPERPDPLEELGHRALEACCWLSVVAMVVAMIKGWLPGG